MMETFNKFVPFLSELGSARRSPTAGSSDIVSPNPVDRVPDTAPQGPDAAPQSPDVAPGSSSASLEPRASSSGLHLHRDDKFAPPTWSVGQGRPAQWDSPCFAAAFPFASRSTSGAVGGCPPPAFAHQRNR